MALLEFFRVGIELDAWNIHFNCYGTEEKPMGTIYWQIVFLMVWPVVAICFTPFLGLFLALLFKQTTFKDMARIGWRSRGEKSMIDTVLLRYCVPLTLLILFVAFPPITSVSRAAVSTPDSHQSDASSATHSPVSQMSTQLAFRTFEACTSFPDKLGPAQDFLVSHRKHFAVVCPSQELKDAQALASVAILLYPVGVIFFSAWLLYLGRNTLILEEENTPYTRSIAFLHASFIPTFFYFDILELAKKLILIGFASLVNQGSVMQLMLGTLITLLFLVLHLQASPCAWPAFEPRALAPPASQRTTRPAFDRASVSRSGR